MVVSMYLAHSMYLGVSWLVVQGGSLLLHVNLSCCNLLVVQAVRGFLNYISM
jgi:hypothetical protein